MSTRRPWPGVRWWVATLLAAPVMARGQAPIQRIAMLHFADSLGTIADTTSLLAFEAHTIDSARQHRDDAMLHLRLGAVGLRLAELTSSGAHFRDAEGEYQWATELRPNWPLGWYGLGNAELAEADGGFAAMRGVLDVLGHDVYVPPAHDLAHSAEVDSTFVRGVVGLANEALHRGIQAHLTTALLALRELARWPAARNPQILLARGRVEREIGDMDSALVAFNTLVRLEPANSVALLELARTQFFAGRLTGVAPWYRGLALADSTSLPMYRFDLSLVMSDSALAAFDSASGAHRVEVVRRFWDTRDPGSINTSEERLREHYRRIDVAHRNYAMVDAGHRYDSVRTFAPTDARFDDRGRIYVRHGEPDDRTTLALIGLPPNETWVYHRPGGDLLFNFAQPDSAQGYRLYESLLDIVGLGAAAQHTGQGNVRARLDSGNALATYGAAWTAQAVQELLYSRERLSPVYRQLLSANPNTITALEGVERQAGRKMMALGLQTDSWTFGYELQLVADVELAAVGADAAGPELQVAFAIPGSSLYAPPTTGMVVYPVRMRVAVHRLDGGLVAYVDTLRNFATAAPLPGTDNLLGRLPLHVPPGDYTVRVAIETASRGMVTPLDTIHVVAATAPAIALSDLALGTRAVPLPWATAPGDTAWINPLDQFKSHDPMQLYFEVGGLPSRTPYRADFAVFRAGHRTPEIQVSFNAVSTGEPDRVRRAIDIGRLGAGAYVLQLTVSTAHGAEAVRRRVFTVIK